jgi:hypothetical protein
MKEKGEGSNTVFNTSVTPIFKVTLNFILNGLAKYKVSRTFIRELIL